MQQLVLKNQLIIGSVNAIMEHFAMAVADLEASMKQWPDAIKRVITEKIPYTQFNQALHQHSVDEIKVVVEWSEVLKRT